MGGLQQELSMGTELEFDVKPEPGLGRRIKLGLGMGGVVCCGHKDLELGWWSKHYVLEHKWQNKHEFTDPR